MAKQKIGSIRQNILVEGDATLLTQNEILVEESDDFKHVLKIRTENGSLKAYAVIAIEDYTKALEEAYDEGFMAGEQSTL